MASALKSWRERLATPLKAPEQESGEKESLQTTTNPQTSDFLRVGLLVGESTNLPQTPESRPRLVRTGLNTWVEVAWARELCVLCEEPLAPGDVIACQEHRRQMDELEMPWDRRE